MSLQFRGSQRHFEAGRHIAGHTGTFWGRRLCMLRFEAMLGANRSGSLPNSMRSLLSKWLRKGVREKVDATDH